ncbi:MAG: amidohydrolase family protein [Bacillota bacterium]|nr:amidohydrolase family protein [Bacillota bacterium]
MKKIILCGNLFTAKSKKIESNKAIIINNNIIRNIINIKEINNIKEYEVIDLSSNFVMPGLIDAHVHINMNGELDSDRLFLYQSPSEITLNSMKYVQDDLMAGYTSLRDVGSVGFSDVAVRNAINKNQYWGPRMLVSGWSISPPGGSSDSKCFKGIEGNHPHGRIVNGVSEVLKAVRENFKYGADAIKLMVTNSDGFMDMTYDEMSVAVSIAKSHNSTVAAHASGIESVINAVKAGITSIEHGTNINEEVAMMMKDNNTFVVPTLMAVTMRPKRNLLNGIDTEKSEMNIENIKDTIMLYKENNVKICFGSDAAIPYISHGSQWEEFKLLVESGLTEEEALLSATKNNSELLNWEDKVGTIEPGKFADIIAIEKNPIDDISHMKNCIFVMKNGTIYKNVI